MQKHMQARQDGTIAHRRRVRQGTSQLPKDFLVERTAQERMTSEHEMHPTDELEVSRRRLLIGAAASLAVTGVPTVANAQVPAGGAHKLQSKSLPSPGCPSR